MNYKTIWSMLIQTFSAWNEHEAPRLGAALAFYTILSLAPLVILVVGVFTDATYWLHDRLVVEGGLIGHRLATGTPRCDT